MQLEDILSSSKTTDTMILNKEEGVLLWIHSPNHKLGLLHILSMYGGVEISSSQNDSIYFFKSINLISITLLYKNIVLRYDALLFLLPAQLSIDANNVKHIEYQKGLNYTVLQQKDGFVEGKILLHSSLFKAFSLQPGVSLSEELVANTWHEFLVNKNATVIQGQLWNVVIKAAIPITGEKKSSLLWQATLHNIEDFLRNKRMQVTRHNNIFLQLVFSSEEQLHNFIFDYNNFITFHSQELGEESFTATTTVITLQKNTSMFSVDIDTYYPFSAQESIFNHCHTTLYDALILKKEFAPLDSLEPLTFNSWVVLLEKQELYKKDVAMLVPLRSSIGTKHCFYCGMRSHSTTDCPTHMFPWNNELLDIWNVVGEYPLTKLIELSKEVDALFEKNLSLQETMDLYSEDSQKGAFVRAIYSLNLPGQLRIIPFMFARKSKEQVLHRKINKQEAQMQYFSKRIASQEIQQVEYEIFELLRQNKDYRYYTFLGFTNIERGEYQKAVNYWRDAERLSYTPKLVAWHLYLQGRAYEMFGQYNNALLVYKRGMLLESTSKDIRYRTIITLIQMGRVDTAMKMLEKHLQSAPEDFVKILFDTQAKQGYLEITKVLNRMLQEYAARIEQVEREIQNDHKNIDIWGKYDPNTFKTLYETFQQHFEKRKTKDFLNYSIILEQYTQYRDNLNKNIMFAVEYTMQRVERIFNKLFIIKEHLKTIPIRSQFKDFSKQLDINISTLEKVEKNALERADYFEFIIKKLDEIESKLGEMESSIYFMQVVRDSSLFLVLFLRNFILVEIIVALLIIIGIPALFYYGSYAGLLLNGVPELGLQWTLQKNIIIVATGIVLILVGSSTLLQFKKKKRDIILKFFEEAEKL